MIDANGKAPGFLEGGGPWAAALSVAVIAALSLSVACVPIRSDNDCWWHVKSGKYIAENGLPETDVFSFTAADHRWHNHEWLAQWLMWKVYESGESSRLGGWRAVILAKSLVIAGFVTLAMLLAWRLSGNWWLALLLAVFVLAVGRRTYYPRPPVISNLMIVMLLLLVTSIHEGWLDRKFAWAIPPFFALWSNLHGGWMAGLVIVIAYAAGDGLAAWRRARLPFSPPPSPISPRTWAALLAATVVATWANPSGWHLYALPARVLGDKELVASIGELQSPNFLFTRFFEVAILGLVFLGATVRRHRARFAEVVIVVFFLHQALQHVRHLLLFAVVMVPFAARLFGDFGAALRDFLDGLLAGRGGRVHGAAHFVVVGAMVAAFGGLLLMNYPEQVSYPERNRALFADRRGYDRHAFPSVLVDYILLAELEGRMYNQNHYAGYLIWRLSPERHLVFSDPRFDIFGGEIWRDEQRIAAGDLGTLDKWDVQWAITTAGSPLASWFAAPDSGWAIGADFGRVNMTRTPWQVWIRETPENASMVERGRRVFASLAGVALDP